MQKATHNHESTYSSKHVVDWYDKLDFLFPAEKTLFNSYSDKIVGKKVLDIGIGGGRTTNYFSKIDCQYTGVDFIEDFAKLVSQKHSKLTIKQCDARNMSMFANESFDFILFSFNGIDNMENEGRIQILKEVFRILKPDGVFMFSAHNKDHKYFNKMPWQEEWRLDWNYIKLCLVVMKNYFKHLQMKKHEYHCPDYSIINDIAHEFSIMTYYISGAKQKKQLQQLGFKNTKNFDAQGKECDLNQNDSWMYYLTYKQ